MPGHFLQKSRHSTVYYFRRRVPDDLYPLIGKRQIYKSLDTCDRREAIIRARALAVRTDQLFAEVRAMPDSVRHSKTFYVLEVDLSDDGQPKKIRLEAEPGEDTEAAKQALNSVLRERPPVRERIQEHRPKQKAGSSLEQAAETYITRPDVKPSTRRSFRTKLNYLMTLVSKDRDVLSIDQTELAELSQQILEDTSRSQTTQKDYITVIAGFLNWCRSKAGLPELNTKWLKPKRTTPASMDRASFGPAELKALFENAAKYRESEPHKFWATIAIAFFGCRVEELAQVNLHTDLHKDPTSGTWYFDLDEQPDKDGMKRKSMKKPTSWRKVPVHSALVRHGFIEFLLNQRHQGYDRPFAAGWSPHIENGTDYKWSHKLTKWGGAELRKLIQAGKLPDCKLAYFHSLRHAFAEALAARGVSEEFRAALQGQAFGGINAQTYAKLKHNHNALSEIVEAHLEGYAALLDSLQ